MYLKYFRGYFYFYSGCRAFHPFHTGTHPDWRMVAALRQSRK
jgi:hypothetical protein